METSSYEALVEAAADGVDFDGLTATRADGRIEVSTPETTVTAPVSAPRSALAPVVEYVTNWYFWHGKAPQAAARWAFLRWLERADDRGLPERQDALNEGVSRRWGQLSITVTLGADGDRRYDLRHEGDAGRDAADLASHEDPRDAREIAETDARGRYRPLKSAPTLRKGWVYDGVDAATLVRAVEYCYPATIQNWSREGDRREPSDRASGETASREGELDVSHWRETMARQTGIYGVIQTWDRGEGHEHAEWVAEACCDDSQCLKRREWEYDAETDLAVDGGDGVFPCREPCSLVVSAARQWTKLEGEQSRTYEFELTPSEKAQVEAIVEAVADGRADEIREADVYDPANRYRARFLRAKRFDEDGHLCGVPTEDS